MTNKWVLGWRVSAGQSHRAGPGKEGGGGLLLYVEVWGVAGRFSEVLHTPRAPFQKDAALLSACCGVGAGAHPGETGTLGLEDRHGKSPSPDLHCKLHHPLAA